MSTFKTRLIEEKSQLEDKIERLESFTLSDNFKNVEDFQKSLLIVQLQSMKTYNYVLSERIKWLSE